MNSGFTILGFTPWYSSRLWSKQIDPQRSFNLLHRRILEVSYCINQPFSIYDSCYKLCFSWREWNLLLLPPWLKDSDHKLIVIHIQYDFISRGALFTISCTPGQLTMSFSPFPGIQVPKFALIFNFYHMMIFYTWSFHRIIRWDYFTAIPTTTSLPSRKRFSTISSTHAHSLLVLRKTFTPTTSQVI